LASGETHSIFEFVNTVYGYFGIDLVWITKDDMPIGYDLEEKVLVKSVEKFYRPNEVQTLQGDSTSARKELFWTPEFNFNALVVDMIVSKLNEYTNNF
jgi:GDPmannose 4,6-dehydratase